MKKRQEKSWRFLLIRDTTGYAGGGTPQKSFSFKHRAKRATSKGTYKLAQRSNRRGQCPFAGGGAINAIEGIFNASLDARQ